MVVDGAVGSGQGVLLPVQEMWMFVWPNLQKSHLLHYKNTILPPFVFYTLNMGFSNLLCK